MKLDLDDFLIKPASVTEVLTRKDVNPYYANGKLPLFTAPMDTVIDDSNVELFSKHFNICLPRKNDLAVSYEHFYSYGYDDFEKVFSKLKIPKDKKVYALIDVANGHMSRLHDMVFNYKKKFGDNLVLMVGNVASPETFSILQKAGADYIRVGIGNGNGCLTTMQTGVGYPMGSLIKECNEIRNTNCYNWKHYKRTEIVADGGFKSYSDIIKALALGADFVMLGSILNKMFESAGQLYDESGIPLLNNKENKELFLEGKPFYKDFRGMSTKSVQKRWGRENYKTSEGIESVRPVEYTYDKWVENFTDYLKSAMSYCNLKLIDDFIAGPKMIEISENSYKRFHK